jgi:hypothetical protein
MITVILLVIHIVIYIFFGNINYIGTIKTKYEKTDSGHKIITQQFEIETPKDWFHVFGGYGIEAESYGYFLTKNGILNYEYGLFATNLWIDSITVFSIDSIQVGRFIVFIEKDTTNQCGIHIPIQYEMEMPFTFFMGKACTDNFDNIIKSINTMKFKKFYNIEWETMDLQ